LKDGWSCRHFADSLTTKICKDCGFCFSSVDSLILWINKMRNFSLVWTSG
jgi:hypothetical protein